MKEGNIRITQTRYDDDNDLVTLHLAPWLTEWLAVRVGKSGTVLHAALVVARAHVVDLLDEIDKMLARLPRN